MKNKTLFMKNINANDVGYLLLRILFGGLLVYHGYGKLIVFTEKANVFADPFGIGRGFSLSLVIFAEFFCGIFIIVGLKVRFSAIPAAISMAVALFLIHINDLFSVKEPAFAYLGLSIVLIICGSGKLSLDTLLQKSTN